MPIILKCVHKFLLVYMSYRYNDPINIFTKYLFNLLYINLQYFALFALTFVIISTLHLINVSLKYFIFIVNLQEMKKLEKMEIYFIKFNKKIRKLK